MLQLHKLEIIETFQLWFDITENSTTTECSTYEGMCKLQFCLVFSATLLLFVVDAEKKINFKTLLYIHHVF